MAQISAAIDPGAGCLAAFATSVTWASSALLKTILHLPFYLSGVVVIWRCCCFEWTFGMLFYFGSLPSFRNPFLVFSGPSPVSQISQIGHIVETVYSAGRSLTSSNSLIILPRLEIPKPLKTSPSYILKPSVSSAPFKLAIQKLSSSDVLEKIKTAIEKASHLKSKDQKHALVKIALDNSLRTI
ncbi:uncharacterized protein LACBIDRAFT_321469 [Laccaria bicolor S238N-H82]|uniref:Predicted protein n=1 Tax=Laccaria bicolor (strain S238N-H82 / ATCC MYA-4686) TaxID=486041 RepID=B0CT03_LACBS|nr:uncharacterized protein LACBIDRAFT_321469 [Laccaria bicolor S238N-H82]EDR14420.1 predicted protein [Laccaria bicolor S238N-H82]|eukprot:XP_001874979.1 predicted protein [Laccaria bicolor S238N-H82]